MCEIFCYNSLKPKDVTAYLEKFFAGSEYHPHGWGLANLSPDYYEIAKEAKKASDSEILNDILTDKVCGKNIFAHIRLATMGEMKPSNCHPFSKKDNNGRTWVLVHNGTIFESPILKEYEDCSIGETDSEKILHYIVNEVNEFEKDSKSTYHERFVLLKEIIYDLSRYNKLNLLIYDGEVAYVHSNMQGTLYYIIKDEELMVSSHPVSDEDWLDVEINKLFCINNGKIYYEGYEHENEFIATPEQEEFMKSILDRLSDGDEED